MSELTYIVVRNIEEQYSIWPSHREIPAGWEALGSPASKEDCLAYIDAHWTDIRPKSLRDKMAAMESGAVGIAGGHD